VKQLDGSTEGVGKNAFWLIKSSVYGISMKILSWFSNFTSLN